MCLTYGTLLILGLFRFLFELNNKQYLKPTNNPSNDHLANNCIKILCKISNFNFLNFDFIIPLRLSLSPKPEGIEEIYVHNTKNSWSCQFNIFFLDNINLRPY
jgi:hypothetical protein